MAGENPMHAGFGYEVKLSYKNTQGNPGTVDLAKSPTQVIVLPDGFAKVTIGAFDDATGVQTNRVDHADAVGDFTVEFINDGDLGAGDNPITTGPIPFTALPPGGASSVGIEVASAESPTP